MKFTPIDYSAFGIWVFISIVSSYILIRKLKFFKGSRNAQLALTCGLILGHVVYFDLECEFESFYPCLKIAKVELRHQKPLIQAN